MSGKVEIVSLAAPIADDALGELADVLADCVAGGASVSFMAPFPSAQALAFFRKVEGSVAKGDTVLLAASLEGKIVGTVQLGLDTPPNQPHRAEIAKLMTRLAHRGKGIASRLMRAAEALAVERGRTLLVLDTATEEGASGLYEKLGFTLTGEIPDFALKPHGGLTGTLVYWKRVGQPA